LRLPIPSDFVTREDLLITVYREEAQRLGHDLADADSSFKLLPSQVKEAPAYIWIFSPGWRYFFGPPFDLQGTAQAIGSPQGALVEQLIVGVHVALRLLSEQQLIHWLSQLGDVGRHADALAEMLAVQNVPSTIKPIYEPQGVAANDKLVDWLVPTALGRGILFEVKNRLGSLAQELERIQPGIEAGLPDIPGEPITRLDRLFLSTTEKFHDVGSAAHIQGVVLFASVKLPLSTLTAYFTEHLSSKLHFIALTSDGRHAHITAQLEELQAVVCSALGWVLTTDLVY
jgi:hypothetical protein